MRRNFRVEDYCDPIIRDRLFLGTHVASQSQYLHKLLGLTAIVSCHHKYEPKFPDLLKYFHIREKDAVDTNLK